MPNSSDPPVKAVATSFRVVDALLELDGAGVSELADHLGLAKSSVHSHLRTLESLGYVVREDDGSWLGLRFFQLGTRIRDRRRIYTVARAEVDRLAGMSGLDAGIVVHEDGRGVCLYSSRGQEEAPPVFGEGDRIPLHATGAGKAILAGLPRGEIEAFVDRHGLESFTSKTLTDLAELQDELRTIESRGIAYEKQEYDDDVRGIGATITDAENRVLGAIFLAGTTDNLSGKQLRQNNPGLVISAKNRIENSLQTSPGR
jgi:DNA-binding IclR family transcriptional regulator